MKEGSDGKNFKELVNVAVMEKEALDMLAQNYGFYSGTSESCAKLFNKRLRSTLKECVSTALLDADEKNRNDKKKRCIVQYDNMPMVRKTMRICMWKEQVEETNVE